MFVDWAMVVIDHFDISLHPRNYKHSSMPFISVNVRVLEYMFGS